MTNSKLKIEFESINEETVSSQIILFSKKSNSASNSWIGFQVDENLRVYGSMAIPVMVSIQSRYSETRVSSEGRQSHPAVKNTHLSPQ